MLACILFLWEGKLIRNNLRYFHKGEQIMSTLKGVTILHDKQHVDHATLVHHAQTQL